MPLDKGDTISMTSPTTIKNRVSILVNGVTRLANEVFGSDLPAHAHHQHTELLRDDHLQYMTCAAGASRPFTGVVYFKTGLALRGEVELSFDDHYRTHSAYPAPGIPLSLAPTEWTAFLNTYGEASILGALVHAHNPYTPGTGISITNNVIANTGVTSLCKNGQTPLGGAWSFVEGANITITQNNGNHTLTIAGQAGGGAYDDSNCFYHSGSRPGTGNWTLFDGEDYHGIGGLTYLRGQEDNQTDLFQGVLFGTTGAIEVRSKDHSTTPTKDARIFATLNEDITGSAVVRISNFDVDKRNEFGLDTSGFYWHDYLARESSNWGSANPFLLADMFGEVNPYDRLYAALGDQRMDLVNILALLAEGGGSVLLEEGAVGFGDAEGLLSGDATHLSWDDSVLQLTIGSDSSEYLGEAAGICCNGGLDVTGFSYFGDHAWLPENKELRFGGTLLEQSAEIKWEHLVSPSLVEQLHLSSDGRIRFTDSGGTLRVSSGLEDDYTNLNANYGLSDIVGLFNSIGVSANGGTAKHANVNLVNGSNLEITAVTGGFRFDVTGIPGTATLQTAYNAGDTIATGANGSVNIESSDGDYGSLLALRQSDTTATAALMSLTNYSDAEAPTIFLDGDARYERDYGLRIWAVDDGGVLTFGRTYSSGNFDGETLIKFSDRATNPYTHIQDAELLARVDKESNNAYVRVTLAPLDDTPTGYDGRVTIGADRINLLSNGDIGIVAAGSVNVNHARSISYGSEPTSITYGTTIAANFLTGSAFQECIATGNITTVTLTAPAGVQTCQLKVTASGGARTITGFSGSVSWGEPIDPDVSAYTIPSGEWVIFWLYWNGSAWNGSALRQFS